MADIEVLKQYLVSLGFQVDKGQLDQFTAATQKSTESVSKHSAEVSKKVSGFLHGFQQFSQRLGQAAREWTKREGSGLKKFLDGFGKGIDALRKQGGEALGATEKLATGTLGRLTFVGAAALTVMKTLVKAQIAVVTAFTAVSAAVWTVVDRVAMADQKYRLLGLRMGLTTMQARKMQTALDDLGVTMEEAMVDPELNRQVLTLMEDTGRMTKSLGQNYEANLKSARALRFEFVRFKHEVGDFLLLFVDQLLTKLNIAGNGVQEKLQHVNEWFQQNAPRFARFFAENLVPILKSTGGIFKELLGFVRELAGLFTNFMALLSSDESLETTEFNAQKLTLAIQKLAEGFTIIIQALSLFVHLMTMAELGLTKVLNLFTRLTDKVASTKLGQILLSALPGPLGVWGSYLLAKGDQPKPSAKPSAPEATGDTTVDQNRALIREEAIRQGVSPEMADAVAWQESRYRQTDKNGNVLLAKTRPGDPLSHAQGLFQLQPGTARELGVNASDRMGNIRGGIQYLAQMRKHFQGNETLALMGYYWGAGNVDKAMRGQIPWSPAALQYARSVQSHEGQNIAFGDINVHITQPNMNHQQTARAVKQGVREAIGRENRRATAQLSYAGG